MSNEAEVTKVVVPEVETAVEAPSVGSRIRALRRARGFTQKILAAKVGVSQPTISLLEKNVSSLRRGTDLFSKLAEVLGVNEEELS